MKKLLLLLFLSITATAQDSTKNFSRFQIGVSIMPEMNFMPFKGFDGKTHWNLNKNTKKGFSTGANIQYNFSNKVAVESGLQYTRQRFESLSENLIFGDAITPTGIDSSKLESWNVKESFNYLVIPLKLNLFLGNGKVRFMVSPGLATYYLLNRKVKSTQLLPLQKSSTYTYSDYGGANKLSLGQSLAIGAEYRINDATSIRVLPTFKRMVLRHDLFDYSESWLAAGVDFCVYYSL